MPVDYKFDKEKGIVFVNPRETLLVEDVEEYTRRLEFDTEISDNFVEIVDFSKTKKIAISYREAWELRAIFANLVEKKKLRASILVGDTDLHFGMARMFATAVEGVLDARVVRSVQEAEEEVKRMRG